MQSLHQPAVVEGLIKRLGREQNAEHRRALITALAIWWLVKQGVKKPPPKDGERPPDQS